MNILGKIYYDRDFREYEYFLQKEKDRDLYSSYKAIIWSLGQNPEMKTPLMKTPFYIKSNVPLSGAATVTLPTQFEKKHIIRNVFKWLT